MSTYWGYVCESHDPPLSSERWFNRGDDVLAEVFRRERAGRWPDDPRFSWPEPMPVAVAGYETTAPIRWLREHPRCSVALQSAYGDRRELPAPDVEQAG